MTSLWPLSRKLLEEILSDHITDTFVCRLIWERLDYKPQGVDKSNYLFTHNTPEYWSKKYPQAPQFITNRSASVHLTRSIPKQYKQLLKECLDFNGYKIHELFPRRTRRATAVSWLLSWLFIRGNDLPDVGPLPTLSEKPSHPSVGHLGDPKIE